MRLALATLFLFASCGSALAQTTTGTATTKAPCSPAVTGDHNTFTFTYCGGDPVEQKRIFRLLQAVANGELVTSAKLDEILAILNRPIKITRSPSFGVATPAGAHPRTAVNFHTDDPVDRGQFEVICDRACRPIDVCRLLGSNATVFETIADHPDIAVYRFQRPFPELTECGLTVESLDDNPVQIIDLRTSNRTANLVKSAVQPRSTIVTSGSVMQ
jgi:hypothetical protein